MRWNCKACKNHCMIDVEGEEEPSVCVMMVTKEDLISNDWKVVND